MTEESQTQSRKEKISKHVVGLADKLVNLKKDIDIYTTEIESAAKELESLMTMMDNKQKEIDELETEKQTMVEKYNKLAIVHNKLYEEMQQTTTESLNELQNEPQNESPTNVPNFAASNPLDPEFQSRDRVNQLLREGRVDEAVTDMFGDSVALRQHIDSRREQLYRCQEENERNIAKRAEGEQIQTLFIDGIKNITMSDSDREDAIEDFKKIWLTNITTYNLPQAIGNSISTLDLQHQWKNDLIQLLLSSLN